MQLILANFEDARARCEDRFRDGYFEFCFSFSSERERFREIDRFLWESRHERTRFENRYVGPTVINITEWSDAAPNELFDAFLYFCKDISEQSEVILVSERPCNDSIISRLKEFFELEITDTLEHREKTVSRKIGFAVKEEFDHV